MRYVTFCMLVLLSGGVWAAEGERYSISGVLRDKATGAPLEYATVYLEELGVGTSSDAEGCYRMDDIPGGRYRMSIQYLGYLTVNRLLEVGGNMIVNVGLERFSLELKEINVSGELRVDRGTALKVTQEVLNYIQPSSLSDIFQLLPGGLQRDGDLNQANQVSIRQAGSDPNTAFGMVLVVDGAPLSNNGNLEAFRSTDSKRVSRSVLNGGVDLRMISTDHLQEAEVILGIPSVQYGDLTSGVVVMKSKRGESPWQVRIKADPLSKLGYIGKGFRLPGKGGTLNAGIDVLQARPDVRERLEKYTRITSAITYAHQIRMGKRRLNYDLGIRYYGALESEKNDPDLMAAADSYNSHYDRMVFTGNGKWEINEKWLRQVDLTFSADYTSQVLKRKMTVTPQGIIPLSLSQEEGESEGIYLPSEYVSEYREENRPLNFFAQFSAGTVFEAGGVHSLLYGYEFAYDKNVGAGALYDQTRPPYPGNSSSSRPRSFRSVPAMVRQAIFAEDQMRFQWGKHRFRVKAGFRLTRLGNLPAGYVLRGKWFAEPRVNVGYTLPEMRWGGHRSVLTWRLGYGEQVKMPSVDYLYPEWAWFDRIEANYYSQYPDRRFLWIRTMVKERENRELTVNRNRKAEVGMDWKSRGWEVGLTAFYEHSGRGFGYSDVYFSFPYQKYQLSGVVPEGKPSLEDFTAESKTELKTYTLPRNDRKVVKKGIEYQVRLPEFRWLRTRLMLNGAYYASAYESSGETFYQPSKVANGEPYPYAGIYKWDEGNRKRSQLNTTVWLNTHIPSFRLYFTTKVQVVWFSSVRTDWFSGVPDAYMDAAGVIRPFGEEERENPELQALIRTFAAAYFRENREPVAVGLNLKATKEIGEHLEVAFFVNRLWDYNPVYRNHMQQEVRKWEIPFFGAELTLKL